MSLLVATESYVIQLMSSSLGSKFLYHSLEHTRRVVKSTETLANALKLNKQDKERLLIAAWFHDVGYTKGIKNHEENSVDILRNFMSSQGADEESIQKIARIIMATAMEAIPKNDLESIIRDADSAHFGSKDYELISNLLRAEWELTQNKEFSDLEWVEENICFFNQHHKFYTSYAQENWSTRKLKNLNKLIKQKKILEEKSKKQNAKALPERGVETMFRVTLRNHIALSDIADTKANILLSVNAIVVSLVLSNLIPKLDNPSNEYLVYPTVVFVFFTVISMTLSVIATRPNVTEGKFTRDDVAQKKVNLLFFGNFHQMPLNDFEWGMNLMMKDKDYLYTAMIKDLYFLGKVLHRKYNILRWTYTIFITGILISLVAFAIAFKGVL